jgi:hypothetical protein
VRIESVACRKCRCPEPQPDAHPKTNPERHRSVPALFLKHPHKMSRNLIEHVFKKNILNKYQFIVYLYIILWHHSILLRSLAEKLFSYILSQFYKSWPLKTTKLQDILIRRTSNFWFVKR